MYWQLPSLNAYFTPEQSLLQDTTALIVTFIISLLLVKSIELLAKFKIIPTPLSRKMLHVSTGPIYILCWNLFSGEKWQAPLMCSIVPLFITANFALLGLGIMKDPAAVKSMSRSGDARELLQGPVYYGSVFILSTVVFWRHSPISILGTCEMLLIKTVQSLILILDLLLNNFLTQISY